MWSKQEAKFYNLTNVNNTVLFPTLPALEQVLSALLKETLNLKNVLFLEIILSSCSPNVVNLQMVTTCYSFFKPLIEEDIKDAQSW